MTSDDWVITQSDGAFVAHRELGGLVSVRKTGEGRLVDLQSFDGWSDANVKIPFETLKELVARLEAEMADPT